MIKHKMMTLTTENMSCVFLLGGCDTVDIAVPALSIAVVPVRVLCVFINTVSNCTGAK